MLRGFPSPFPFMSHMETAKATENYALTFRKSEAVKSSYMCSNDDQIGSQMSSSVRHFWEIDGTITA